MHTETDRFSTESSGDFSAVAVLRDLGPKWFFSLAGPGAALDMSAKTLKSNDETLVLRLDVDGRDVVTKVFARGSGGASGRAARVSREIAALRAASGTGLTPMPIIASPEDGFVTMGFVAGSPLAELVTDRNVLAWAERLGTWYGKFSQVQREVEPETTWGEYLFAYDDLAEGSAFAMVSDVLSDFDIPALSLAKNDAALSNFILDDSGQLIGFDFEAAQIKPLGWDILLTARMLARQFPAQSDAICTTLARAFCACGIGDVDRYIALTRWFVIATVFAPRTTHNRRQTELLHA